MAKTMKKVISLLLAAVLILGTFAGCGKSSKDEPAITASAVKFSKSGQYTTTVSSDKVDLSGINAKNVEVRYLDPNTAVETEAVSTEDETQANTETAEEVNPEEVYTLSAKVESVKAADKKNYEITFTDENAADYATSSYVVLFKGIEGKNNIANVAVEFPEITLTPDVEFVTPSQKDIKLTLSINGSEFEDEISVADITLGDSFDRMEREVISSSANNLTLEIKGDVVKNVSGAYQWGTVGVKPSAIKDGYTTVEAKTNIQLDTAYLDPDTIKYKNGKVTADLKVYGVADADALTKDNVKLEGVTTETLEKADANTAKITFSADKIGNVNDFVDLVSGKAFELGDYKTEFGLAQANMYPVFDYVEEDGDNLKLTLKLYANGGTFSKKLKAKQITLADDFKGARVESAEVDSDTVATLIISVPANGATAENFKLNGTVTLAQGTIVNPWGEKTSKDASYTRDYSGESLGREVSLNGDTLLEIQKYTRGLNTMFGKICYYGGVAGKVFSIGKTVLEAAGVLQSDQAKIMEQFSILNEKIDGIIENQGKIMSMLDEVSNKITENSNDRYRENLNDLRADVDALEDLLWNAAMYMALDAAVKDGRLDKMPRQDEYENYTEYLPDVKDMSNEALEKYNNDIIDFLETQCENHNSLFDDFTYTYENLKKDLGHVADKLSATDSTNPITRYDTLCSYKYNFDSQCYEFRSAQRGTALDLMARGLMIVFAREKVMTNSKDTTYVKLQSRVQKAALWIDESYNYIGHPADEIKAFPHKETVGTGATYISDIAVAGAANATEARQALAKEGYYEVSVDLNRNAGGHFIFVGYKYTTDYSKAIKDAWVEVRAWPDTSPVSRTKPSLCPVYGDDKFVNSNGDLNCGAGGVNFLYLHQSREAGDVYAGRAISKIWVDSTKPQSGGGCPTDLNYNSGGDYLYLHYEYANDQKETGVVLDGDPEYYPYSYVLGKKVAIGRTSDLSSQRVLDAALQQSDGKYRNWSEAEIKSFISRTGGKAWNEELKSAGLKNITNRMPVDMHWDSHFQFTGSSLKSGSNTLATHKKELVRDNLTYFKLFDYVANVPYVQPQERPKEVAVDEFNPYGSSQSPRKAKIDTITIDVWDTMMDVDALGWEFVSILDKDKTGVKESANYAIDKNGKVGQFVFDGNAAVYTGNTENDNRSIIIVVTPSVNGTKQISEKSYEKLVNLVAYQCDQNGISQLVWNDDSKARANHQGGANVTLLRDFKSDTDAPGSYLYGRMKDLVKDVNAKLDYVQ